MFELLLGFSVGSSIANGIVEAEARSSTYAFVKPSKMASLLTPIKLINSTFTYMYI